MRTHLIGDAAIEPETELEMGEAECLALLGRPNLGRIAIVIDGQPQIFPVNYAINGRIIAIRTAAGSKLTHAPDCDRTKQDHWTPDSGQATNLRSCE